MKSNSYRFLNLCLLRSPWHAQVPSIDGLSAKHPWPMLSSLPFWPRHNCFTVIAHAQIAPCLLQMHIHSSKVSFSPHWQASSARYYPSWSCQNSKQGQRTKRGKGYRLRTSTALPRPSSPSLLQESVPPLSGARGTWFCWQIFRTSTWRNCLPYCQSSN